MSAAAPAPAAHGLSAPVLLELARTGLGPEPAALLTAGQRSKRMLLLRAALDEVPGGGSGSRFLEHWQLLEAAERSDPDAVRRVLCYPTVGVWLHRLLRGSAPERARLAERLGAVAAAAVLAAGAPVSFTLPLPGGELALPSLGLLRAPGAGQVVVDGSGLRRPGALLLSRAELGARARAELRAGAQPSGWFPLRLLVAPGGARVLLDDVDPFRDPGLGSERSAGSGAVVTGRLPGRSAARWLRLWAAAGRLLAAGSPGRAAEVAAVLSCVVPLRDRVSRVQSSATSAAAFGLLLTTAPPGPDELAAIAVHEVQHAKLGAVHDLLPLYDDADRAPRYWAPWRPDPRPLPALFQGTYAHLALADHFGALARAQGGLERGGSAQAGRAQAAAALFGRYHQQVAAALPQLRTAPALTDAGARFVAGMAGFHAELAEHPPVDLAADRRAVVAARPRWAVAE